MGLPKLSYEKVWTSAEDFPTYEGSEEQVRLDNQYHPDAIKDFINNELIQTIESTDAGKGASCVGVFPVSGLMGATTVQAALEAFVELVRGVTQGAIPDGSISAVKLTDGAVSTQKITDGAVTSEKLADAAVIAEKIAELAITAAKIADSAVLESKIKDGAVSENKIATGAVSSAKIAPNSIGTSKIEDSAVTGPKIADGAITTDKLASGAVTTEKLATGAVGSEALKDASVTADKLSDEAITAGRLVFSNVAVETAAFTDDTSYEDFPFKAAVTLGGALSSMWPEVVFGVVDAMSGVFAPAVESYNGGIYIYASEKPEATITIPTIVLWR